MTMVVAAESPPLSADAAGVFRVGNSRVTLETVVGAFRDGATAEEIADQYPAISLGQVYATIAYYLAHTAEVNDYLRAREQRAAEVREANERIFHPAENRARLIARQAGPESACSACSLQPPSQPQVMPDEYKRADSTSNRATCRGARAGSGLAASEPESAASRHRCPVGS